MKNSIQTTLALSMASLALTLTLTATSALAAGKDSESLRAERDLFINAKPTPFLALGAGLEVGGYTSENAAFGVSAEFDHYLVGGSLFAGPFGRRYFGNSFFVQAGLGYTEFFFNDWVQTGTGAHATFGNEWQFDSGLILGGDWLGITYGIAENTRSLSFPKMRIGWAF